MTRRKMKMELIKNEKFRATTYQKRKRNLIKKAQEFSILCNVKTCVIMYGPKMRNNSRPPKLETWPSDSAEVKEVINMYKALPLDVRKRKCFNVFDFFATRDEISKQRKANFGCKFSTWDDQLDNLSVEETFALVAKLDSNLESAKKKLKMMKGSNIECSNINGGSKSGNNNIVAAAHFASNDALSLDFEVTSRPQLPMPRPSYNYPFALADGHPMQPFNSNPLNNSMAMMPTNSSDFSQFDGESSYSSSCLTYSSVSSQPFYDPAAASMLDNVRFNNQPGAPFCFYGPLVQPLMPPSGQSDARPSVAPWLEKFNTNKDNLQHGSKNKK